jgi:hypothetical protein
MYPNSLTQEQFQQENTQEQKLQDAEYFICKGAPPRLAARDAGLQIDEKTALFIENLALHLEELWPEVAVHTELEFIRKSKTDNFSELPWN